MSLYDETLECWGVKAQIHKFSEELGELIVAMHHWYDSKCDDLDLAEEIADVEIVCSQLRLLVGDDRVDEFKIVKLSKLRKKVDECKKLKPLTVQGTQWSASPSVMLRNISAFPKSILSSSFIKNIQSRITKSWDVQGKE